MAQIGRICFKIWTWIVEGKNIYVQILFIMCCWWSVQRNVFLTNLSPQFWHLTRRPEAQFVVPDWGDRVDYGIGLSNIGYIGWRAGTTTIYHSRLYSPIRDYEFGYSRVNLITLMPLPFFCQILQTCLESVHNAKNGIPLFFRSLLMIYSRNIFLIFNIFYTLTA